MFKNEPNLIVLSKYSSHCTWTYNSLNVLYFQEKEEWNLFIMRKNKLPRFVKKI